MVQEYEEFLGIARRMTGNVKRAYARYLNAMAEYRDALLHFVNVFDQEMQTSKFYDDLPSPEEIFDDQDIKDLLDFVHKKKGSASSKDTAK